MAGHQIDTVMHFAAHISVESMVPPFKYYGDNACAPRSLLQARIESQVENFVFCSTAAVYGTHRSASGH
jgi:UDP-glucose 4-epimerase